MNDNNIQCNDNNNNNNESVNCLDYLMQQHKSRRRKQIKLIVRLDSVLDGLRFNFYFSFFFYIIIIIIIIIIFIFYFFKLKKLGGGGESTHKQKTRF